MLRLGSDANKGRGYSWLHIIGVVGILLFLIATVIYVSRPAAHAAGGDWPTFLAGNERDGFNSAETIINPNSAPNLQVRWTRQAGGPISAEPVEANGLIYWGSWDGVEHATNPSTHTDVWTANLGQTSS